MQNFGTRGQNSSILHSIIKPCGIQLCLNLSQEKAVTHHAKITGAFPLTTSLKTLRAWKPKGSLVHLADRAWGWEFACLEIKSDKIGCALRWGRN